MEGVLGKTMGLHRGVVSWVLEYVVLRFNREISKLPRDLNNINKVNAVKWVFKLIQVGSKTEMAKRAQENTLI